MKNKKKQLPILQILLAISFVANLYFIYDKFFVIKPYQEDYGQINVLELYQINPFLRNYRAPGFENTFIPTNNPFGGTLYELTTTTAYYGDKEYLKEFGTFHDGIDLIPNKDYYTKSTAYLRSKQPVVFSTINGNAKYLFDEFGANYLVITNDLDNLRVLYVHLEASFIKNNDRVVAGQPIGVMGSTGKSTGKHLHYEVQIKENDNWKNVNPAIYITK